MKPRGSAMVGLGGQGLEVLLGDGPKIKHNRRELVDPIAGLAAQLPTEEREWLPGPIHRNCMRRHVCEKKTFPLKTSRGASGLPLNSY